MTRRDLAAHLSDRFDLGRDEAAAVVSEVFGWLAGRIAAEGRVELRGFGVFRVVERSPRKGRDMVRGAWVEMPARRAVTFRPGKAMAGSLNREALVEAGR